MKDLPPPHKEFMDNSSVPDYYCGRLIYYDDSEAMRYVVYDGVNKIRFASRSAAEKWCTEQYTKNDPYMLGEIMRAYHHLTRASVVLRHLTEKYAPLDKEQLEAISVNARRMADALDFIQAKYINPNK